MVVVLAAGAAVAVVEDVAGAAEGAVGAVVAQALEVALEAARLLALAVVVVVVLHLLLRRNDVVRLLRLHLRLAAGLLLALVQAQDHLHHLLEARLQVVVRRTHQRCQHQQLQGADEPRPGPQLSGTCASGQCWP